MNGSHSMPSLDVGVNLDQLSEIEAKIEEIYATLTLGPADLKKMEDLRKKVASALEGWKQLKARLGTGQDQGQHKAICNDHITFLKDFKKRCKSETHDVLSSEFDNYERYVGLVPTGTCLGEPWKAVELVKMGKKEVNVLQLVTKKAEGIATARIVAPHSDPESGYWVHYPSKTIGDVAVRPIHTLSKEERDKALRYLSLSLQMLSNVGDEREKTGGIVRTNDDGPIEIVDNPAKPDAVIPFEPCTTDEFFEKLGYLSIEHTEGKQGRVVAIADTKWDERLYHSFKKIFHDPLPVVFTHGNLVPEKVLCYANGGICEITGWEHAGWLPQGWEGAAALRNRGSTNTTWHDMGSLAVAVLDRSFSLGRKEPICGLWQLENARLNGRLAPHSWYDNFASPTRHCKDQTQSIRRIRECTENSRAQSGGEGLIASDGEVPTV